MAPTLRPTAPRRTQRYRQVLLRPALRSDQQAEPRYPTCARDDALAQVLTSAPWRCSANRAFHKLLVTAPVQYQKDGETRGDFVRLIDWGEMGQTK